MNEAMRILILIIAIESVILFVNAIMKLSSWISDRELEQSRTRSQQESMRKQLESIQQSVLSFEILLREILTAIRDADSDPQEKEASDHE